MKRCAYCGREYPDEATRCALDQQPLELLVSAPKAPPAPSGLHSSNGWPPQVVIAAVLWLIVNFFLVGLLSVAASFLFGLLTALWAAIDCSKLQARGSRIAFKPFVVFAVVAFLLWGFGFIWYLIMRHRVLTSPMASVSENATTQQNEIWKCQKCGEVIL